MQKIQSGNQVVMKPNGNRHDARNVIAKDERDCITKRVQKIHRRCGGMECKEASKRDGKLK